MDEDLHRCLAQVQRLRDANEMIGGFVDMYTQALRAAGGGRNDMESVIRAKGEKVFAEAADIARQAAEHIAQELGPLDHQADQAS
ncbi:MAG TPA: hypothetical protein VGL60_07595 [Acidimicrobiales bacterium]|jgi:hypothetical protein